MLLPICPHTFILSTVTECEFSEAISHIFFEFALVCLSVFPSQLSLPMHLVCQPVTLVHSTVSPLVNTEARYLVILELSLVLAAVCLFQCTFSIF